MKIGQTLLSALVGWAIGMLTSLGLSFILPRVLPIAERISAVEGQGKWSLLLLVLIVISPISMIGGVVGSRMVREGGRAEQFLYAALFGLVFTMPVMCILYYMGW
jgi:hypothetical protein